MTAYNGNIAKLTLVGSWNGQLYNNVTYWDQDSGAWDAADLVNLAVAYGTWVQEELAPILSEAIQFTRVDALSMVGPEAPFGNLVFGAPVVGGLEVESVSNSLAACLTITTPFSGRSSRGRQYVGGLAAADVVENVIQPAKVAALNNAFAELIDGAGFDGFHLGVYSQFSGGEERPAGVFRRAISIQLRDNIIDSQRRRLPGRGN